MNYETREQVLKRHELDAARSEVQDIMEYLEEQGLLMSPDGYAGDPASVCLDNDEPLQWEEF